jgi:hypothetical protein
VVHTKRVVRLASRCRASRVVSVARKEAARRGALRLVFSPSFDRTRSRPEASRTRKTSQPIFAGIGAVTRTVTVKST